MRSIKFKAWDNRNECWLFDGNTMDLQYSGESGAMMFDNDANMTPRDSLVWVQFTGLHDKSGKEIYEGDICDFPWGRYVVEFDEGRFELVVKGYDTEQFGDQCKLEVIGNIYESPELLTA